MKYGESSFDILYLLFAVICGIFMLVHAEGKTGKRMGLAALVLGIGDAFHLVPRVLNYFTDGDLTAALGIGKLITSLTMTVFYVFMYYIWQDIYRENKSKRLTAAVLILACMRLVLCLFPQNGWVRNSSDVLWGTIRNIPFAALGAVIIVLFYRARCKERRFRFVWLYILLSFLFYVPVAVGAGLVPILGMLMLPKTICYILILVVFLLYVTKDERKATTE